MPDLVTLFETAQYYTPYYAFGGDHTPEQMSDNILLENGIDHIDRIETIRVF